MGEGRGEGGEEGEGGRRGEGREEKGEGRRGEREREREREKERGSSSMYVDSYLSMHSLKLRLQDPIYLMSLLIHSKYDVNFVGEVTTYLLRWHHLVSVVPCQSSLPRLWVVSCWVASSWPG